MWRVHRWSLDGLTRGRGRCGGRMCHVRKRGHGSRGGGRRTLDAIDLALVSCCIRLFFYDGSAIGAAALLYEIVEQYLVC
mmetsp:Transcript_13540/g.23052  ORF Transcript_13540/g.23052 Transcript_13540/m.23052 type:complete len:80 (-) Transcript_13540:38-277(-)